MNSQHILIAAFVISAGVVCAQVGSSSVTGRVVDATNSGIPGADVKITNVVSGSSVSAVTNTDGVYHALALLPGPYRVTVRATGFDPAASAVTLEVARSSTVDFVLQVGAQSQSVEVISEAPPLNTQESSVGQLVSRAMIGNLPIQNRAATSLVNLSPGVVMINNGEGAENYPVFSVMGGRARNQEFTLDGGNVTNAVGVTRPQQQTSLPVDAMEEFRVISNNYSAEYGHSTGGIISLSTRSGTNQFHGSLFEFARNSSLDARNFFATTTPPLNMHQFGGSLGGPIVKDKTHFFVSWEETRKTYGLATVLTVPTVAQRSGHFSAIVSPIYDPATLANGKKQTFAGNMIPVARIDPVAAAATGYVPLPNRGGANASASNFGANSRSSLRRDIVVGKLDHSISERDQLTVRYYINDFGQTDNGVYSDAVADPNAGTTDGRVQSILASHVHTFSPSLINKFSFSYDRRSYIQRRFGYGDGYAQQLGLDGVTDAAFPTFLINGYASLGALGTINAAAARVQLPITDTQFLDSVSKFAGKHAIKAGIEYRRGSNSETDDITPSGSATFTRQITGQPGVSGTGDAFASFLLGQAYQAGFQRLDTISSHASYWSTFVQDDYRVTNNLTVNFGLRWEVELPRYVDENRMNAFDPLALNPVSGTPGLVTFAGVNGVPRTAFDPNFTNFGPRFGFAYNPSFAKRLVVRGGAGIFYGPMVSTSVGPAASLSFGDNLSLVAPSADTTVALTLRNGFPAYTRQPLDTPGYGAVKVGATPQTSVTYFDRNRPTPVSYQTNLGIQFQLSRNVVAETGYIGNVSHHLTAADLPINQVRPELLGPGNAQVRRPFPQFSNVIWINPAIGNSTYHAGFIKIERRFDRGFSILAHYTFSKFLDDVASANEFGDPGSYMDLYNRRLDKGRSGSDLPQRFVASALYEIPRFRSSRSFDVILGGWQVGALTTLQSGQPFTVFDSVNRSNAFSAGTMRPNLVGDPQSGPQTLSHWFNTAAFQSAAPFTFGNSPRSVLRGPSWKNVDFTASKSFRLSERWKAELRGDFFNALNQPSFDIPGHTLGNADFGVISSAEPARSVQLALRLAF